MKGHLPPDGPIRMIFLRALRDYSDRCTPPELTPGCPFAIDTASGRGCGEECMDILAEHSAPGSYDELALGQGLVVRSRVPRSRRGPTPESRVFDGRQVYLEDKPLAPKEWRAAALLYGLRRTITTPPVADADGRARRVAEVALLLRELEDRGFDVESLIRFGIGPQLWTSIQIAVVVPVVVGEHGATALLDDFEIDERWGQLLFGDELTAESRAAAANDPSWRAGRIEALFATPPRHLAHWTETAPITDLVAWTPPEQLQSGGGPEFGPTGDVQRWVIDRFTTTYLDQWNTASLHLEWEYARGVRLAPCHPRHMVERRIDSRQLDAVVALRSVQGARDDRRSFAADTYVPVAVTMLSQGRRAAAAAIFEGMRAVAPDDANAHNNYGFCLLLDNPEQALDALETAANLGLEHSSVNVANRMLALARLGRITTALDLADRFYRGGRDDNKMPATMWSFDGPLEKAELIEGVSDMRSYVARLALRLASDSGDEALTSLWAERAQALLSE